MLKELDKKRAAISKRIADQNALRARLRTLNDSELDQELNRLSTANDADAVEIAKAFKQLRMSEKEQAEIFLELKIFVEEANVEDAGIYIEGKWRSATQPFRISDHLTDAESKAFLVVLGEVTGNDKFRSHEGFKEAIRLVQEYRKPKVESWWHFDEVIDAPSATGAMTAEEFMRMGE